MNKTIKIVIGILVLIIVIGLIYYFQFIRNQTIQKPKKQVGMEVINIGAILPLSGPASSIGIHLKNGIEIAKEEINREGKSVDILYEDGQGKPELSISAFKKLTEVNNVKIIITALSRVALSLLPSVDEKKILLIGNVGHPEFTKKSKYTIRVFEPANIEAEVMANYVKTTNFKNIALLVMKDDYAIALANIFKDKLKESDKNIVLEENYLFADSDFRGQLLKIKEQNPDFIYIAGFGSSLGKIIKQARELGIESFIGGYRGIIYSDNLTVIQDFKDKIIFTSPDLDLLKNADKSAYLVKALSNYYSLDYQDTNFDGNIWNAIEGYLLISILREAFKDTNSLDSDILIQWLVNDLKKISLPFGEVIVSDREVYFPLKVYEIKKGYISLVD